MKIGSHEKALMGQLHESIKVGCHRESYLLADDLGIQGQIFNNIINPRQKDSFKTVVLLKILEKITDPVPILRLLCGLQGYIPVAIPDLKGSGEGVFIKLATTAKELGELSEVLIEAYQDGKLDPEERKRLVKEAQDIQIAAGEFIVAVQL